MKQNWSSIALWGVYPFLWVGGVNFARLLIASNPSSMFPRIRDENLSNLMIGALLIFEATISPFLTRKQSCNTCLSNRSQSCTLLLSSGIALALCKSSAVSHMMTADLVVTLAILHISRFLLSLMTQRGRIIQNLLFSGMVACVAGLFGLTALPNSIWVNALFKTPLWI